MNLSSFMMNVNDFILIPMECVNVSSVYNFFKIIFTIIFLSRNNGSLTGKTVIKCKFYFLYSLIKTGY